MARQDQDKLLLNVTRVFWAKRCLEFSECEAIEAIQRVLELFALLNSWDLATNRSRSA